MDAERPPRLSMSSITKTYGDFVAVNSVDFQVLPGEVHALVGENGAGKSTLMKVLSGQVPADSGTLAIDGVPQPVDTVLTSRRGGVGFVEQEGGLVEELDAVENLRLMERSGFWARRRDTARRLAQIGESYGLSVNLSRPVGYLQIGDRQRVEILTVLTAGASILILDEPTAALSLEDAAVLASIIRRFVDDGGSVIYISHKLKEVLQIADRITVMRRGAVVGHYDEIPRVTVEILAEAMIGSIGPGKESVSERGELIDVLLAESESTFVGEGARSVCSFDGVGFVPGSADRGVERVHDISLKIRSGEIVGIAGVVGSGQQTLAELLVGLRKITHGSQVRLDGPIGYIPENRRRDAIAGQLSLRDNMLVHSHRRANMGRGIFLASGAATDFAAKVVDNANVRAPSLRVRMSGLSGGNQQRAVVGRELERNPVLVVANNPYRGLDVRAIHDVKESLHKAAANGAGVVVISPDLDELFPLCSRILVLFDGRVIGEVSPQNSTAEEVGRLMGGAA